jgi:HAD superfamily hydrolase (TIGR01509 family)
VLTLRGEISFKQTFIGQDEAKLNQMESARYKLNMGQIGYDDFIDELAKISGTSRGEVLDHTENYQPDRQLLDYIKNNLKPHYKIGIISNAGEDWVLKIIGQQNQEMFDDIVLSYKCGMVKPQAGIYELSAKNLDVKTNECVFVNDISTYAEGAKNTGMQAVWYQNFEQFKQELGPLLATSSNN